MKRTLLPFAALTLILAVGVMVAGDNPSLRWLTLPEAMHEAPKNKKKIVLDIYTDWCGWCKRMDKSTYGDSTVTAYLNQKFVLSKMNPEKEGTVVYEGQEFTQREFAQALKVRGYPATAFLNENNEVLTVVGGYMGPEDFLSVLKYFGEDTHLTMTWEEYKAAENQ